MRHPELQRLAKAAAALHQELDFALRVLAHYVAAHSSEDADTALKVITPAIEDARDRIFRAVSEFAPPQDEQ
jgi:hypothetical protein